MSVADPAVSTGRDEACVDASSKIPTNKGDQLKQQGAPT
jgi:hypothetical protein